MFSLLQELGLPVTTKCGPKRELKKFFGKKQKRLALRYLLPQVSL